MFSVGLRIVHPFLYNLIPSKYDTEKAGPSRTNQLTTLSPNAIIMTTIDNILDSIYLIIIKL